MELTKILESQRKYFQTGATLDVNLRLEKLKLLKDIIKTFKRTFA